MNTSTSAPIATTISKQFSQGLSTLSQVIALVKAKRATDLARFRTCCADPRASK